MKKIIKGLCVLVLLVVAFNIAYDVFALGEGFDPNAFNTNVANGSVDPGIQTPIKRVVHYITLVVEVLAIGGVVFLGVKYMYAGSSDKANIKQTLIYAVIGVIFVFAASSVVDFFLGIGKDVISP